WAGDIGEADFEADFLADRCAQFLTQTRGDRACRNPPWLRMPNHAANTAADFQADFCKLCRFAAARFAADYDDLVVTNRRRDLLSPRNDWQRLVEFQPRYKRLPLLSPLIGFIELLEQLVEL